MMIDEKKDITPYYVEKTEGKEERKYTDHYMITAMMNISMKETCKKYVNILDEEGWAKFREELQKEKVSEIITNDDIRCTYPKWREQVSKIRDRCSKKVKI